MSTISVVLIVVAIVGLVVVAMAVQSLITTLRSLRATVEDLREETMSAVAELRATVALANGEIERVDSLLDTAETVGARVEATSRLAWLVMRNPLVKLASLSVATDRNAQRLARNDSQIDAVEPLAITDGSRGKSRRSRNARNVTSRRERRAS
jgi:predicted PurR-regulated permease PerM